MVAAATSCFHQGGGNPIPSVIPRKWPSYPHWGTRHMPIVIVVEHISFWFPRDCGLSICPTLVVIRQWPTSTFRRRTGAFVLLHPFLSQGDLAKTALSLYMGNRHHCGRRRTGTSSGFPPANMGKAVTAFALVMYCGTTVLMFDAISSGGSRH